MRNGDCRRRGNRGRKEIGTHRNTSETELVSRGRSEEAGGVRGRRKSSLREGMRVVCDGAVWTALECSGRTWERRNSDVH